MPEPFVRPWHLLSVEHGGSRCAAIGLGDVCYRSPVLRPYAGAIDVLRDWEAVEDDLRAWRPHPRDELAGVVTRALPLGYPAKVLCSGPNYTDHLAEMGESGLGADWSAYFFLKPPTTTLVADGEPVLVDDPAHDLVDWEGELGVVIGRGGRRFAVQDALSHVAGYLVANDVSLRGPHRRQTPAAPFQWDWLASKGADTSLPIGPMVPHWLVPDPQQLSIVTRVNGEVRQDGKTADMVLDVARLVSDASHLVTLEPGDLILTGTPAGVGASHGTYLWPGDDVEVTIEGVGSIRNRVERRPTESAERRHP